MSWNRRNAAGIGEIDVFAVLCPSSARTHPNRSRCRTGSRRFTYTSICSITILFLGSLDRSTGSRIMRTASIRFSRASSSVAALCQRARNIISPHPPFAVLYKTCLDLHKIDLLSAIILRETADNANRYVPFIMGIGPFRRFKPFNDSTVREASRQASATTFSSEPVGESPRWARSSARSFDKTQDRLSMTDVKYLSVFFRLLGASVVERC
jgi:hypothetical protein